MPFVNGSVNGGYSSVVEQEVVVLCAGVRFPLLTPRVRSSVGLERRSVKPDVEGSSPSVPAILFS